MCALLVGLPAINVIGIGNDDGRANCTRSS